MQEAVEQILEDTLDKAVYDYGYADLTNLLPNEYSNYRYGITIQYILDKRVIDDISEYPISEYYDLYNKVNSALNTITGIISMKLQAAGIENMPIDTTLKMWSMCYLC
jgi:hypothetical protein